MREHGGCKAGPSNVGGVYETCQTVNSNKWGRTRRRYRAHDAEFVSKLLADGTCIWTDESTLRVENESEWGIMILCPCTQDSKLLHEVETIGGPRTSQEDKVKELHALYIW